MNLGFFFPKFCIMPWILHYLFSILPFCMGGMISIVVTDKIVFDWSVSNQKFLNGTGAQLNVPVDSNLIINCPYQVAEYYKIYWVPADIFNNCFIPNNVTLEPFLICDTPFQGDKPKFFELNIIPFNGVYGHKDFIEGKSFYLATMSLGSKNGMNNTYKGACKYRNMKLNISVVDKPLPTTKAPTDGTNSHITRRPPVRTTHWPTPTTVRHTTTPSTTTSTRKATTKLKTTSKPPSTDIPDINSGIIIDSSDNGNSAVIDANDSGKSLTFSWLIVLSICLSVLNLVQVVR